ncbi:MAG: hypothetical protein ACD_71C00211G0002 [uncultured bacterium (gcode 4)]|uniref:Uncharacterized protein n=1 Tax=uncultured bacterium (gcode 4) TaxID=1234023 RepID=K1YMN6_9BACT|nr:MAG: hypothetical protein ACD_71C00211G0002 [uncultured bacterium (gcode 4)]
MLKVLDIEASHDKEKVSFVLKQIKTFINPSDCGCVDFSLTDDVYNEILTTSGDVKWMLLRNNNTLQDELTEISLWVISEFYRILNGKTQWTIQSRNITEERF